MARFVIAVVLAVALVAGVAACGDEEDNGLIRFLVAGDPEELAAYREVIEAYKEENPDAEVTLVEASDSDDLITRLSTSTAGGSPPDLFLINYRSYGQFAARDAIESIDDRLGDSAAFAAEDFYPEALDAFRWQGEQLCLPQNVSSLVVYYNRDLFRRYQVAEPRAGWTWDDFVRTASLLTRDANGQLAQAGEPEAGAKPAAVHGLGVEPVLIRMAPFVWSNGGQLVDDDEQPTRFTLDTPAAKQALQSFLELRTVQGVTPSDEEVESEDLEARFANGRLAMLLQSRRVTPTFRTIEDFDWDVAPLPAYGTPASILHSDAFCMTSGSEHKDAAWRFVEFALGTKGQEILAQTGRTVPSLKSVAGSDAFLDPVQKPNSQVFLDVIPTIRHVPSISTWPEIEDVSEGILENGFYLGTPVDDVVRELDVKTRPLFARGESP